MRYRFTRQHRPFNKKAGDPVPDDLGAGVIRTLLDNGYIEAIEEKAITAPPADKSMKTYKTRRKAIA